MNNFKTCDNCNGSGLHIEGCALEECHNCNGTGNVPPDMVVEPKPFTTYSEVFEEIKKHSSFKAKARMKLSNENELEQNPEAISPDPPKPVENHDCAPRDGLDMTEMTLENGTVYMGCMGTQNVQPEIELQLEQPEPIEISEKSVELAKNHSRALLLEREKEECVMELMTCVTEYCMSKPTFMGQVGNLHNILGAVTTLISLETEILEEDL